MGYFTTTLPSEDEVVKTMEGKSTVDGTCTSSLDLCAHGLTDLSKVA